MSRQKDNLEILNRLREYVATYPDQRFGQILRNVGVVKDFLDEESGLVKWVNHFNEEPSETIERMEEAKENMGNGFLTRPVRKKS